MGIIPVSAVLGEVRWAVLSQCRERGTICGVRLNNPEEKAMENAEVIRGHEGLVADGVRSDRKVTGGTVALMEDDRVDRSDTPSSEVDEA
ncbi:hypothetical protein IV203_016084 [Nitzschia inconspicua]|uniref:Uncharacterized protein n=1 Tax=Nitzschia inconspicua TaxID=303405 RepID=A0A9K3KQF5_9STRA|nr:hypothetical protein IV203_016084 [Nitzschia inconspicua]